MLEAEVQFFAIALEILFPRPRPFVKEKIDDLAVWLTDSKDGFALRPEQVRVRHHDIVFDYELTASFFGGNAVLKRDAEKIAFSARGARTRADLELLHNAATRFLKVAAAPEQLYVSFSSNAHAALTSESVRDSYLARFQPKEGVVHAGALGYVRNESWPEEIRIAIEPSIGMPNGLFFTWQTRISPSGDVARTLTNLVTALEDAARLYGIGFKSLT
jgi:hypothetical protein